MKWLTRLLLRVRHNRASASTSGKKSEAIIHDCPSGAQQTHFFDLVPVDALFLILRHFSKDPFSERCWVQSVDVDDVKTVLRLGGALGAASREMFKSLEHGLCSFDSWIEECMYAFMVRMMAPQLENMVLYPLVGRKINCEQLCSLRVLSVVHGVRANDLKRILIALGNSLEELDITNAHLVRRKMVQAIAWYCKSLKVFKTDVVEWHTSFEPIWQAVGDTLVEYSGHVPENELAHIAHHCTRLEKLDLMNIEELVLEDRNEVIDLLKALKALRVLNIVSNDFERNRGLSTDQLRMLLAACPPSVKIHGYISLSHGIGVSNFIRGIGAHLQVLNLEYSLDTMPSELLPALVNIEELSLLPVEGYSDEMIESVFVEPLLHLQKLRILHMKSSNRLRMVARSVTNLREFECSFRTGFEDHLEGEGMIEVWRVPVCGTDFIELLCANVHLRFVGVNFGITRQRVTNEITEFIPLLKVCDSLEYVEISNTMIDNISEEMPNSERVKEISNACVPLRNKSFSLFVNGVYYLPS